MLDLRAKIRQTDKAAGLIDSYRIELERSWVSFAPTPEHVWGSEHMRRAEAARQAVNLMRAGTRGGHLARGTMRYMIHPNDFRSFAERIDAAVALYHVLRIE